MLCRVQGIPGSTGEMCPEQSYELLTGKAHAEVVRSQAALVPQWPQGSKK